MGQFLLFFAGLLLGMLTGLFGNWAISSWYYHKDHPPENWYDPYLPFAAFIVIFLAMFGIFVYIGTFAPFL
ncbi:hypothetical protein [Methanoregula sp. UBA64]|jgi:hypothetical protein|uniref:hypothetical protein n=1 Tax=Methanoregula sp. UBA64 TaxID=1915554 RepID=UPI0025FF1036|nr:hypothetical protein [Methanoregula sp. UBA64]